MKVPLHPLLVIKSLTRVINDTVEVSVITFFFRFLFLEGKSCL